MRDTNTYVKAKSSLDIVGIYLQMLRSRFTTNEDGFPWEWNETKELTKIIVEAGTNEYEEGADTRPGIFVDRSAIVFPSVVLGDTAAEDLVTGAKMFYTTPGGQMQVDCVSKSRGESSILGDIVAHHLVMSGDILQTVFGFRDITPVTLMPTQAWEKDDRCYITRVTSEFKYDLGWFTQPIANKISRFKIELSTEDVNQIIFSDIAIESLG